jgi:hypothetical protein
MQLCVMKRTIPRRILSFDRMLSDILLLKLTLKSKSSITLFLQPFEDKIEFFKVKKALLGTFGIFGLFKISMSGNSGGSQFSIESVSGVSNSAETFCKCLSSQLLMQCKAERPHVKTCKEGLLT